MPKIVKDRQLVAELSRGVRGAFAYSFHIGHSPPHSMSRFNPHFKNADEVFAAADEFRNRCLLQGGSLFLTGQSVWTPEHFQVLKEEFVDQPDTGAGSFWSKLKDQMSRCQPLDVVLMTEIFWIVQLPVTNLKPATKATSLRRIWEMPPGAPEPFPGNSPLIAFPVLGGLGSGGPGYNNYLPNELMFAVEAFGQFCAKPLDERKDLLAQPFDFAAWLDSVPSGKGRQLYHTLCHVLFPDAFERIFSRGNKYQVARAHQIWKPAFKEDRVALDMALLKLRAALEATHPGEVDYYAKPVGTLVNKQGKHPLREKEEEPPGQDRSGNVAEEPGATYVVASAPTLRMADNLILYGPPGTGKTFEMQRRMKERYDAGDEFEFVAFHPSYSYEDFVGGLRPLESANGVGIQVRYEKGPFLRICDKAHSNPSETFTLFIDEINRANVAKVLGELVTLIEPTKRVISGSKPNDNGAWVRLPGLQELFGVPDNLHIVATMNTADRSVAAMDIALRRRFRFQEFAPEPNQIQPRMVGTIDLTALLEKLNDRLNFLLDRDHAIGHAYLMGIDSLASLRDAIAHRVIPLLEEYFFEDIDKVRLVLTGSTGKSPFFHTRALKPQALFANSALAVLGTEGRTTFAVTSPDTWSEEDIRKIYDVSAPAEEKAPFAPDAT
jgi:5-methylcytosine-specific restriction protein B